MNKEIIKQILKKRFSCARLFTSLEVISIENHICLKVHDDCIFFIKDSKEVYIDIKDIKKIEIELMDDKEDINHYLGRNKF